MAPQIGIRVSTVAVVEIECKCFLKEQQRENIGVQNGPVSRSLVRQSRKKSTGGAQSKVLNAEML